MQSVRAGAVQTYFSIFTCFLKSRSNKPSCGLHFGDDFRLKCHIWVKKRRSIKIPQKLSRQTHTAIKKGLYASPQGPWQAASRTRCSNKKQRVGQLLQYFHTLQSAIWIYNPTIEQITDECCCKGETTTIFRRRVMVKLLQNFRK